MAQKESRLIANAVGINTYTANGSSGVIDVSAATSAVNVEVITSAVSGTSPNLVITGQWSFDGGVSWSSSDGGGDTWNAITANGQKMRQHTIKGPLFRLGYTITGTTPSFTIKVNAFLV